MKNLKRSKKKYRATVVSLVISLALFLTVSQYISLIKATAGTMDEGYNYDISLDYTQISASIQEAADKDIGKLSEVREVVFSNRLWVTADTDLSHFTDQAKQFITSDLSESAAIGKANPAQSDENQSKNSYAFILCCMSLDQAAFEAFAQKTGVDVNQYMDSAHPRGILINYGVERYELEDGSQIKVAGEIFNYKPGDVITTKTFDKMKADGAMNADGTPVTITIGALTDERPLGVTTPGFRNTTMVVSRPVLDAIKKSIGVPDEIQRVQHAVYMTAAKDDLQLEKKLNELMEGDNVQDYSLYNVHSEARTARNRNMFLGVLIYGFIALITLICIANIFNTVSTNVALRRKEFAMLRSVGMTPKSFRKMIRYESIFYGFKGLLYGLPLSLVMAYLLFRINRIVMDFTFTLPWRSYLAAIFMILAIVLATMLYASAKVRKENIVDALKDENL